MYKLVALQTLYLAHGRRKQVLVANEHQRGWMITLFNMLDNLIEIWKNPLKYFN